MEFLTLETGFSKLSHGSSLPLSGWVADDAGEKVCRVSRAGKLSSLDKRVCR